MHAMPSRRSSREPALAEAITDRTPSPLSSGVSVASAEPVIVSATVATTSARATAVVHHRSRVVRSFRSSARTRLVMASP
jgi:hypothetical protein